MAVTTFSTGIRAPPRRKPLCGNRHNDSELRFGRARLHPGVPGAGGIEHAAAIPSAPAVSGSRATASPVTIPATAPRRSTVAIVASESGRGGSNRGCAQTSCQMCAVLEGTGVRPRWPEDHGRSLGPNSWQQDRDAAKTGVIERVLTHVHVFLTAINALYTDFGDSPPPVPSPAHVLAMSIMLPRPNTPAG